MATVARTLKRVLLEHGEGGESQLTEEPFLPILYFFFALFWGLVARHVATLARNTFFISKVPYTAAVLIVGFLLGLWWSETGFPSSLVGDGTPPASNGSLGTLYPATEAWVFINGELVLFAFLPALVMADAMATNVHIFKKSIIQILILAFVAVGLGAFLTAVVGKYVFPYNWNWYTAMALGSILSATDPVAVVALLKELGAPRALTVVITGESLLNDGSAAVMFRLFLNLQNGISYSAGGVIGFFARSVLGGPAIGLGFGLVAAIWIGFTGLDAILQAGITVAAAYLGFFVSEFNAEASGVLTVVTMGLVIAAGATTYLLVGDKGEFVTSVWEFIEYVANTVIFFLAGTIVASRIFCGATLECQIQGQDWGWAFLLFVFVYLIRLVVLLLLLPILSRTGYGLTWRDAFVMSHGGLRGAVGLSLAITWEETAVEASERDRALVIFFTSFIVMATLLFNGPTTPYVAKFLGVIEDPTAAHEALQQEAKEYVTYKVTRDFRRVKHGVLDSILGGSAKRDIVAQYVSLGPIEESQQVPEMSLALGMDGVERGKDGFEKGLAGTDAEDVAEEGAPKLSPTSNSSPSRISTVMEDAEGEERAAREGSGSGRACGRTVAATRDSTSEAAPPAEPETLPSTPASTSPPPSPPQPGSPSSLPTSPEATMTHSASRSLSKRVLDLAAQENAERSGTFGSEDSQDADAMAYEKVNARVIRSVADLGVVTGDAHSSSPHMTSMSRDASVAALNELATKKGFAHGFAMREHDARAKGHAETGGAVLEMLRRTATLQVESEEAKAWKTDVSEDQRREKVYTSVRCSVSKELRTRFYMGLQRAYWNQLTEGYLEERAANVLIDVTDEAIEQVSMEMFSDWDVLKRHCPEGKELRTWYQRLWARANYFAGQYVGFSFSNDVVTGASLAVSYILAHREATAFLRRVLGAGVRRIARKKERESHRSSEDGSPPPGGRPEAKEGGREFTEQMTLSSLEEDSSTRGHANMRHRTQSELDLSALAGHSRPRRYAITATLKAAPGARERAEKTARATVEAFAEAGQGIANDISTGGRAMINMGREVMAPLTGDVPAPDGEQLLEQDANAINAQAEVEAMDDHAATAGGSSSPRPAARVHGRGMDLYERLSSSGEMLKRTKTHHVVLPQPIAGPGTHEEDVTGEEISICHSTVKNELTRLHEMSEVNEAHALAYLQRLAEVRPEVLENLRTVQVINLMLTREAHVVEDLYKEGVVNEQDKEHYLEELNDKRVRANRRFLGLGAVVSNERAFRRSHGTRVLPNDESRRAGAGSSRREQGASQQLYDDQRRPWWRLWSSRSSASDASQRATGDEHTPDSGSDSEKAPWWRFWGGR